MDIGADTTITTAIGVTVITGHTTIAMVITPRAGTVITVVPATTAAARASPSASAAAGIAAGKSG